MSGSWLEVVNLGYGYAGCESPSLADVSFSIEPGQWIWIAGDSGAGKSTLLRALTAGAQHDPAGQRQGRILLCGAAVDDLTTRIVCGELGQSPDAQLCASTVQGELAFGLENRGLDPTLIETRILAAARRSGIETWLDRPTRSLSGGEKQRVLLTALEVIGPALLVLDEPLAQLDPAGCLEILRQLERLRDSGTAIVMAEHRRHWVEPRVDRVLHLAAGRMSDATSAPPATRSAVAASSTAGEPIVRVDRLTMRFEPAGAPLWSKVSFTARSGERIALVGPNGSGKSTLLHVLAGLVRPTQGACHRPSDDPGGRGVALLMQNPDLTLLGGTIAEEWSWGPRRLGCPAEVIRRRVEQTALQLGLSDRLDDPPQTLSQGERLRVALGSTLTLEPRLLLLDEPTLGQDPAHAARLFDLVCEPNSSSPPRCLIFATHDLDLARRYATRVIVLAEGGVAADGHTVTVLDNRPWLASIGLDAGDSLAEPRPVERRPLVAARGLAWSARFDPRVKLVHLFVISLLCVLVDSPQGLVALGVIATWPCWGVRFTRRMALTAVVGVALTVWGTVLSQALFYPFELRTVWWQLWPESSWWGVTLPGFVLYREGAWYGLVQSLRFVVGLLAGISVCTTTPPERLLAGLVWLRLPTALSYVTMTALAALPQLVEQAEMALRAQWLRSRQGSWRQAWSLGVLGILAAAAIRRSVQLARSVRSRGFQADRPRSSYPVLRLRPIERWGVLGLVGLGVTVAVVKSWSWLATFGG